MKKIIIIVAVVSVVGVVAWVMYKKVAKKLAERKVVVAQNNEQKAA